MLAGLREALKAAPVPKTYDELCQKGEKGETLQSALRQGLRTGLDIHVPPLVGSRGKSVNQICLTCDEMRQIYSRRVRHMMGHRETLQWAIQRVERLSAGGGVSEHAFTTPARAVASWHGGQRLPDSFVSGVSTASTVAKLRVELLCYTELENVPESVEVRDARR